MVRTESPPSLTWGVLRDHKLKETFQTSRDVPTGLRIDTRDLQYGTARKEQVFLLRQVRGLGSVRENAATLVHYSYTNARELQRDSEDT